MQIRPVLSALRRHKAGTVLITLQIALTLAIVCNALFVVHLRLAHQSRRTGIDESDLVVVQNQWIGKPDENKTLALMKTDLEALRRLPGVADAYATNAWPLLGGGWTYGMGYTPEKQALKSLTAIYFADDHALDTLGLKLVAGRNFRADEIGAVGPRGKTEPAVIIVTRTLADVMFPGGDALGKLVYISARPSVIVGIVASLQTPRLDSFGDTWSQRSALVPYQLTDPQGDAYLVRARPGQREAVDREVRHALYAVNRMRVIDADDGVQTFAQVRAAAYESDRGLALMMSLICAVLLAITAAGIVGLTSFWVGQRRKQIGIRRALGATRRDILDYFLVENLLIGIGGVILGSLLAGVLNLWLSAHYEMTRMPLIYIGAGILVLLVLGQAAVLAPALRASRVPPIVATRSV